MTPVLAPLSVEWFRALQGLMNAAPEKYRRIGASDLRVLVRVAGGNGPSGKRSIGLVFQDYGCADVSEVADPRPFDPDFTIEGPRETWEEMIANIREHGGADARHTLNTLALLQRPLRVTGDDQSRVDLFARFNCTLQEFFNEAARLEGRGAEAGGPAEA
jgi:hypothetical protein